jgi:hypothetical protein
MPIILATQEAEIRRLVVQSQPWQIVFETLSQKIPNTKQGWWSGSNKALSSNPSTVKKSRK